LHFEHTDAPALLNLPPGHNPEQFWLVEIPEPYRPAGQEWHVGSFMELNVPCTQGFVFTSSPSVVIADSLKNDFFNLLIDWARMWYVVYGVSPSKMTEVSLAFTTFLVMGPALVFSWTTYSVRSDPPSETGLVQATFTALKSVRFWATGAS
jgi:hypothetical protein